MDNMLKLIDVYENTVKSSIDVFVDLSRQNAIQLDKRVSRAEEASRVARLENVRLRTRVSEIIGQEMASMVLDEELLDSKTILSILSKRIGGGESRCEKSWLSLRERFSR